MKYPFTPEILDAMPEELAELFRSLEIKLLDEICSRLKIAENLNEVTVQDIRALRSHRISLEDIEKAISDTSDESLDKLDKLLDDVVERNQAYYTEFADLAKITAPQTLVSEKDIDSIRKQTLDTFTNITQSMGFVVNNGRTVLPMMQAYQWALDNAAIQIESGAISYSEAIKNAITQLADSGIKTVDYASGHVDQVDVAVRRATLTGINQLNQKYRDQSMDYLETDLVETTAHLGARNIDGANEWDNHEKWQGGVYRMSGKPRTSKGEYESFEEKCGFGSVTGIGGANCRHGYYPFVEGVSERTWTDEALEALKGENHKFIYEGKEYDGYTSTQKQRQIERTVRRLKRRQAAYSANGQTAAYQATTAKIRRLSAKYKEFSEAAGLPAQKERMKILYT